MKKHKLMNLILLTILSSCSVVKLPVTTPSGYPSDFSNQKASGGVDGGGGKSVVCRNDNGTIISAELLDLFEGSVMYGLQIKKSETSMDEQIKSALNIIPAGSRSVIEVYASKVKNKMIILPVGNKIEEVNDSLEVVLPSQCKAEQLARYYSDDRILVNGEIWEKLSETDRAALILHEAIYTENRMFGAQDSRRSRHVVANLFNPNTLWINPKNEVPENALNCFGMNGALHLWAYQNESFQWILKFNVLGGARVVSEKTAVIADIGGIDFLEAKNFPVSQGEEKIGNTINIGAHLTSKFEGDDIVTILRRWEPAQDINGQTISGYQAPRYYLSWKSGSFPNLSMNDILLNCSLKLEK